MELVEQKLNDESSNKKIMLNSPKNSDLVVECNNESILNLSDTKPYRLTIQIDKMYLRPCPKSKKIIQLRKKINNLWYSKRRVASLYTKSEKLKIRCQKEGHFYQCLVCKKIFTITSELYAHIKEHFTCDICKTEFASKKSYNNHYKLHESQQEKYPYKCHICELLFETKEMIRKHSHIKLDKYNDTEENRIQYCKTCNMTFRNEPTYRKHLNSHVEKIALSQLNEYAVNNLIPANTDTRSVIYNCGICNESFTNITDIERHTETHLEDI